MSLQGKIIRFANGQILRDHTFVREDLWVRDGVIIDPQQLFWGERVKADETIDCRGQFIAPGFIDIQINGAFGIDFSSVPDDPSEMEKNVLAVAKGLLRYGVTSFCPTVITSPPEAYRAIFPWIQPKAGGAHGASVLGLHVEGPFISRDKSGAHPVEYIRGSLKRGLAEVEELFGSLQGISLVTLAPELDGAAEVVRELVRRGVHVSMGHSACHLEAAEAAAAEGARLITHLFNAMAAFHHRDPGLVGLLSEAALHSPTRIFYGLIVDGYHTHKAAMQMAYRTHPTGCVLVTDAIAAMGLGAGTHHLGRVVVQLDEGHRATVSGTNTLAGSAAPMDACVRRFAEIAGVCGALDAAALHPAQALGIEKRKGTLAYGADADLVVLDPDLAVAKTYIAGQLVWFDEKKTR